MSVDSFEAFLATMGIGTSAAQRRIRQRYTTEIASALAFHLDDLNRRGMKRFADLIASNIRIFLDALGLVVPDAAKDGDAFVGRTGGCLLS